MNAKWLKSTKFESRFGYIKDHNNLLSLGLIRDSSVYQNMYGYYLPTHDWMNEYHFWLKMKTSYTMLQDAGNTTQSGHVMFQLRSFAWCILAEKKGNIWL